MDSFAEDVGLTGRLRHDLGLPDMSDGEVGESTLAIQGAMVADLDCEAKIKEFNGKVCRPEEVHAWRDHADLVMGLNLNCTTSSLT